MRLAASWGDGLVTWRGSDARDRKGGTVSDSEERASAEPVGTASDQEDSKGDQKPSLTMRWGLWVAAHKRQVLLGWLVLFIVAAAAYPHLMASLSAPDYSVTGSDSAQVTDLIQSDFSAAGA